MAVGHGKNGKRIVGKNNHQINETKQSNKNTGKHGN